MKKIIIIHFLSLLLLTSCHTKEINYLNNETNALREDFKKMNALVREELERRIVTIEDTLSSTIKDTRQTAANRGASLSSVQAELESLKGSLEELDHKIAKRIEPIEGELAKLIAENEKNKSSTDNDSTIKKNLEATIQNLEKDVQSLRKNYTDQLEKIRKKIDALLASTTKEKTKS